MIILLCPFSDHSRNYIYITIYLLSTNYIGE